MASRAVVHQQQPRGEGKQKNGPADVRNRRVLQDIGNMVKIPIGEVKPRRPITRSFCAQLLANAQAGEGQNKVPFTEVDGVTGADLHRAVAIKAEVQKKKAVREIVDGRVAVKPTVHKKSVKLIPETVIDISSDEEDRSKPINGSSSREGSSRKKVKTLTSILTARSKAACEPTNKSMDPMLNIDSEDVNNELAVVEYIDDIYQFYKLTEDESRVNDYMNSQPQITVKMRSILVDWLIEVHNKFKLTPEALYLMVNILDRYLSMKFVPRKELQLVGIGSMLIACKYEEIWAPEVSDFIYISSKAYTREMILLMEKAILGKLEWYLTVPTPYVFLVRYIKASIPSDEEMENMVFFLAELGLMDYSTVIMYCPSLLAASAVYAARCTLEKSPLWSETLKYHTGYSEDQLMDCAKLLVSFHSAASVSELKAVLGKFSSPDRGSVALLTPAKSLLLKSS